MLIRTLFREGKELYKEGCGRGRGIHAFYRSPKRRGGKERYSKGLPGYDYQFKVPRAVKKKKTKKWIDEKPEETKRINRRKASCISERSAEKGVGQKLTIRVRHVLLLHRPVTAGLKASKKS